VTLDFLIDLAWRIADEQERHNYDDAGFQDAVARAFRRVVFRLEDPMKLVDSYSHTVDPLLAKHKLAPIPTGVQVDSSTLTAQAVKGECARRRRSEGAPRADGVRYLKGSCG
jgi:hypothetical protein